MLFLWRHITVEYDFSICLWLSVSLIYCTLHCMRLLTTLRFKIWLWCKNDWEPLLYIGGAFLLWGSLNFTIHKCAINAVQFFWFFWKFMFQINIPSLRSYLFLNPEVVRSCNQINENFQLAMPTGAGFKVTATFHQHIVAGFISALYSANNEKIKIYKITKNKGGYYSISLCA